MFYRRDCKYGEFIRVPELPGTNNIESAGYLVCVGGDVCHGFKRLREIDPHYRFCFGA